MTFNIPPTRLIHIDIDAQEIGRNYKTEIGAVADVKNALKVILNVAKEKYPKGFKRPEVISAIASYKQDFEKQREKFVKSDQYPMRPERILADLREVLPQDGYVVTDVGWNKNGVGQQFPIYVPGTFITPGGLCTMGYGPSAALGVKLARPDRKVVALIGDGAMGANPSPMATAAQYDIPVVWVVMNNAAFGTIACLKSHYGFVWNGLRKPAERALLPDFAAIANAYSIRVRVSKADEFKGSKGSPRHNKPCLIEVYMAHPCPDGVGT